MNVSDLARSGYTLKERFLYKDITTLVRLYLRKKNAATISFLIFNAASFLLFAFTAMHAIAQHVNGKVYLFSFFDGFVVLFVLIPVHEVIHAIAYKMCGAKRVSFEVNLKKLAFLTVADQFVANKKEFTIIVFAPFVVISAGLIITYFFGGLFTRCTVVSTLLLHTLACAGDFSLSSYFLVHREDALVTYDDNSEKATYFYEKEKIAR